ncbi:hypothetical protein ASC71_03415 [Rhizobium sp. Root1240]|nr:hypothetical protein ASC71_03415 [Rhizobium sp. Root1240]
MLAEAAAAMGWQTYYVTNLLPIFWSDFINFPHHASIQVVELDKADTHLPTDLDFVIIAPGSRISEFYENTLETAVKRKSHIALLNFESENWFNQYAPVKRSSDAWAHWRRVAAASSVVLSIASEGSKYAEEYYKDVSPSCRFSFAYPPINQYEADRVAEQSARFRILLLARFEGGEHKGSHAVTELITEQMLGSTLTILVGTSQVPADMHAEITEKCGALGIPLEWKYKVSDYEKFELYKQSKLLLFPSLFEGYGYPPIEARYCGCPVVVFDLPVLRETCGNDVAYAVHGDWTDFNRLVAEQLRNPRPVTGENLTEVALLSVTSKQLSEAFMPLQGQKPDYSVYKRIYGRPKRVRCSMPKLDILIGRVARKLRKVMRARTGRAGKVTYFPRFRTPEQLANHYYRAAWYLPYKKEVIDQVNLFRSGGFKPAPPADHMHAAADEKTRHLRLKTSQWRFLWDLFSSDVILVWDGSISSRWLDFFRHLGVVIENVNTNDLASKEYGIYPGIAWRHMLSEPQKKAIIEDSYRRFSQLISEASERGVNTAAVFGTGPSIDATYDFDFTDAFTIICNSTVQDDRLMDHIKPRLITAGDAVSHFGVSTYAAKFRSDLRRALSQRDLHYFGTATFGYILALHYPEMAEKFIFIEQRNKGPNFDLLKSFSAPMLDSTMNIHMLPVAATVADDIYILGCDGRKPEADNEDFWAHSKTVQYHDLVETGHLCHPTFDTHRKQGAYGRHEDSVRSTLEEGERLHGKRYTSLKTSYIPAFSERELDPDWYERKGLSPRNGRISLTQISENHDRPIPEKPESSCSSDLETLLKVSGKRLDAKVVHVRGWVLSPYTAAKLCIHYGNQQETIMRRLKRPDVAKAHPIYEQDEAGFETTLSVNEGTPIRVTLEHQGQTLALKVLSV